MPFLIVIDKHSVGGSEQKRLRPTTYQGNEHAKNTTHHSSSGKCNPTERESLQLYLPGSNALLLPEREYRNSNLPKLCWKIHQSCWQSGDTRQRAIQFGVVSRHQHRTMGFLSLQRTDLSDHRKLCHQHWEICFH